MIADPAERLAAALDELYAYYERNEAMWTNVLRDETLVDALPSALTGFWAYLDDAAGALAEDWGVRGGRRRVLLAATRHAVDFHTWRSLDPRRRGRSPGRRRARLGDDHPRGLALTCRPATGHLISGRRGGWWVASNPTSVTPRRRGSPVWDRISQSRRRCPCCCVRGQGASAERSAANWRRRTARDYAPDIPTRTHQLRALGDSLSCGRSSECHALIT